MSSQVCQQSALMPALQGWQFICPVCKVPIGFNGETFHCTSCERRFPVISGIPDFRVFEDRNLPRQEDLRRVAVITEALPAISFQEMLDLYWSFSDITPEHLRKKYIAGAVSALDKGRNLLEVLQQSTSSPLSGKRLLEVGSGTGGTMLAAAELGANPVGVDIAMRWLHVTRKRFMEAGLPSPALVCCCAEYLPFSHGSFDAVVSSETLEFAVDKDRMIAEIERVMKDNGSALVRTANRLSISKDPFVHLYGIGFLPRAVQISYARLAAGAMYQNVQPTAKPGLDRLLRKHFGSAEYHLPTIEINSSHDKLLQIQARIYSLMVRNRLFTEFLKIFGPSWNIVLRSPLSKN